MNLPNGLTIGRLVIGPVIVLLLFADGELFGIAPRWFAAALFVLAALTDYADGMLARRLEQQTRFGALLDPIADKVLIAAVLVGLTATGDIAGWALTPAIVILAREFVVSGLREFLARNDGDLPVSRLSKWKTTAQMVAVAWLIIVPAPGGVAGEIGLAVFWFAGALTLITGFEYVSAGLRQLSATAGPRKGAAE